MANIWDNIGKKLGDLLDDLSTPDLQREELARGAAALEAGDAAAAEAYFRGVVDEDHSNGRAWQLLGMSLLALGRRAEALETLRVAAERRTGDTALRLSLVEEYRQDGDLEEALYWGKEALRTTRDEAQLSGIYRLVGELHLARRSWGHAVRELRKANALADGEDPALSGLLGLALCHSGDLAQGRPYLERAATSATPEARVMMALVRLLLKQGETAEAWLAASRLLQQDPENAQARLMGARCKLAAGDLEHARRMALELLQDAPDEPGVHRLLGEISAAARDPEPAVEHLHHALELVRTNKSDDINLRVALLKRVISLQLQLESAPTLADLAEELLELRPANPLGWAAHGLSVAETAPAEARARVNTSLSTGESGAGHLVMGLLLLDDGDNEAAARQLEHALRLEPANARARRCLEQCHRAAGERTGDFPYIASLTRLLESHHALKEHAPAVIRVREVFDRPLLVCVMGEFNSGKSSLVNALIGEEVAAMGVTPTTATINLLKYGHRKLARVIWRDDREELLAWSEVRSWLDSLAPDEAAKVRQVELLYPAEELLRVNVVDTPGLNSLVEGHEETAREVLARADAVIWLFSAQQAGKQTEKEALALLGEHRLKTVGVLNKIDRLSAEELEQVLAHLRDGFSELVESVLPVSTRQALKGLVGGDQEQLARSRFPALRDHLEEVLFSRSQDVKVQATARRLEAVITAATATMQARQADLELAEEKTRRYRGWLASDDTAARLSGEVELLRQEHAAIYRRGASEVLEFVRPRRWVLGEHQVAPADRDFLLGLLTDGLHHMCDESLRRMTEQLRILAEGLHQDLACLQAVDEPERLNPQLAALDQLLTDRQALLREQVYTRYRAYARGCLEGGRVDRFLGDKLPHLKLDEHIVHEALWEDRVDLKVELLAPLTAWQEQLKAALMDQLDRLSLELDLCRQELTTRYLEPLLKYPTGDDPTKVIY